MENHGYGWWGQPTPLKNSKVNWDDDTPKMWNIIKFMFQTTNQICLNGDSTSRNLGENENCT